MFFKPHQGKTLSRPFFVSSVFILLHQKNTLNVQKEGVSTGITFPRGKRGIQDCSQMCKKTDHISQAFRVCFKYKKIALSRLSHLTPRAQFFIHVHNFIM